ncbi:hypothetical protein [Colwellia sp. MB3u-64]|uniref:hypothetical protein n=1 Tax=Colwellia sp. MB3u-64 TaxID=2759809 RepID=UPI0015F6040C|nr:hypothetical protein [Colwellia sp. MB3u-64]MBA6309726.1 hypothetical protein [Colwellia sp. MB3u-64]
MSKKKGMFSWLGLGRQQEEVTDAIKNSEEIRDISEKIIDKNQDESLAIGEVGPENILAEPEPEPETDPPPAP